MAKKPIKRKLTPSEEASQPPIPTEGKQHAYPTPAKIRESTGLPAKSQAEVKRDGNHFYVSQDGKPVTGPFRTETAAAASADKINTCCYNEGEQGSDPTPAPKKGWYDRLTPSATTAAIPTPAPAPAPVAASPNPLASLLKASIADVEARKDTAPHLIVEARAGTGKTTTLVEGLKLLKGIASSLIPSPQQKAVWDAICLSKGKANTVCFVAFNKSIATELQARVPAGCDAMTMHSMGFKAVNKAFNRLKVNQYRVQDIIAELLGRDIRELKRDASKLILIKATEELVGLCKMNLVGEGLHASPELAAEALSPLAAHYDVDLNGSQREVFDLVPRVLERCKDTSRDGCIDYDDMIWLPVVLNLPVFQYDMLLVDEAQDLNRCQQALAKRAGKRLILCGDPKQAIYGFAGADSQSMKRMEAELSTAESSEWSTENLGLHQRARGCATLPLTVTRRCGKAIVAEANKIVPDFEAHETCCEGRVGNARMKDGDMVGQTSYTSIVQDGDMLLCRVNAPLVSACFKFLRAGRKANIQGRDVGQGLISTIKKLKASSVIDLVAKIDDWRAKETGKENAKRTPNEGRLIAIQDRADCLVCFMEGAETVDDVIRKVESVFTDDKGKPGIKLSSVHKAKGLEARRVFILQPKGAGMPHPMAKSGWQQEQEMNIKYVAITRAIEELVWVS